MSSLLMKSKLKTLIEELFDYRIFVYLNRMHGHEEVADIKKSGYPIKTIFDVGANVGKITSRFLAAFPQVNTYCFEPVSNTYNQLVKNLSSTHSKCFRLALKSSPGQSNIYIRKNSLTNSLIHADDSFETETVDITTIDLFAAEHQIPSIDLLKIDTEGFDLEVLKGAKELLSSGRVRFVLVEVGFHPGDETHVLFDDVKSFLFKQGFSIFGIYNQFLEWSGEQRLRFANVLFCYESPFTPSLQKHPQ